MGLPLVPMVIEVCRPTSPELSMVVLVEAGAPPGPAQVGLLHAAILRALFVKSK